MAVEDATWKLGGITFPLTGSREKSFVEDADPGIFQALNFFAWGIDFYAGERFKIEMARHELNPPKAVVLKIDTEPSPFLYADQFDWPIFALWRKRDVWDEHTIAFDKSTSTWAFAYVLGPLTPRQQDEMVPMLRAVAGILRRLSMQGRDKNYMSGVVQWDESHALIQKIRLTECTYGGFEKIDTNGGYFRALTGTFTVLEREDAIDAAYDLFDGADANLDVVDGLTDTIVADVVQAMTRGAPTIVSCSPDTGPKAGGTSITITGTNFDASSGSPVYVWIGKSRCATTSVTSTTITATTTAHAAFGPSIQNVVVLNPDGQRATLPAAFTFTDP